MVFYDIILDTNGRSSKLPGVILDDEADNGIRCRLEYGVSNGDHDHEETEASISWKAAREQGILDKFLGETAGIGLAGVLCGEGISCNPHMIKGRRFYTYAVCNDEFETWKTTDDHDEEWDDLSSLELVRTKVFNTNETVSVCEGSRRTDEKGTRSELCVKCDKGKVPIFDAEGTRVQGTGWSIRFQGHSQRLAAG